MVSKLDICNLALAQLGQASISSLDQEDEQARRCTLFYEPVRREILRTHNWRFARGEAPLTLIEKDSMGSACPQYVYAYPQDCLFLQSVFPMDTPNKPVSFQELYRKDLPGRVIICGAAQARACYTRDVTDTTIFDPAFIKVFSLALAADLAITLTGDMNLAQKMLQKYALALEEARRSNMTESFEIHTIESSFVEQR